MSSASTLPIDPLLPEILRAVSEARGAVIEAPPGAGKTTRVPRALLQAGEGEVVVLEPRRLAARMAAARVAQELGEPLGQTVGYQVRFESVGGARTRLRFVTQGVLLRRMLSDPRLTGIGTVVLDEFHERQIESDLVLALARRLQRTTRPDLRILCMSATLEAEPVAGYLGVPRLRSVGRTFEVAIEHLERPDDRPLAAQVVSALSRLIREGLAGHVLVFLPGAGEIERARATCRELADRAGLELVTLHGDLSPQDQDRAVAPSSRRKIILSTNVAESSVTIDGVAAVVDSGLARIASHAAWSGLPMLRLSKVSRASCTQRAGRAGRTGPGRCLRLYTRHDHDARPAQMMPEVKRLDLAEPVLLLRASGVTDVTAFDWFEPPPPTAVQVADELLERLGALAGGRITERGRRMLRFPLHPRLGRLLCEAESRGVAEEGCAAAAWLGERARGGSGIDLEAALEAMEALPAHDPVRRTFDRTRRQLLALCDRSVPAPVDPDEALLLSILTGYPDRVARRRDPKGAEVMLAGGGSARLATPALAGGASLLVATQAEERRVASRGGVEIVIQSASPVEPEWLVELFPDRVKETDEPIWNRARQRVERVRRVSYDALVLEERSAAAETTAEGARLLASAAREAGLGALWDLAPVERWLARLAFARTVAPALPEALAPEAALDRLCAERSSFAELREASLLDEVQSPFDGRARALCDRLAPERITLPGGRAVRVSYESGKPPSVASRLQDFFGSVEGPRVGGGAVPVVLELLAPNGRPVQVTTDLAGFWTRHYPQLRRELGRRYPRHSWPEDPVSARPPAPKSSAR